MAILFFPFNHWSQYSWTNKSLLQADGDGLFIAKSGRGYFNFLGRFGLRDSLFGFPSQAQINEKRRDEKISFVCGAMGSISVIVSHYFRFFIFLTSVGIPYQATTWQETKL